MHANKQELWFSDFILNEIVWKLPQMMHEFTLSNLDNDDSKQPIH